MPSRLADLIRKARRLAAERDKLIDGLATEWTRALRGQGLSAADLDELWAGLVEEAGRHETQEVIARVRKKVETALDER